MKGELDSVKVESHCLKEPDYSTMTLMSLYGTLERVGDKQARNYIQDNATVEKKIKNPEIIYDHFFIELLQILITPQECFPLQWREAFENAKIEKIEQGRTLFGLATKKSNFQEIDSGIYQNCIHSASQLTLWILQN